MLSDGKRQLFRQAGRERGLQKPKENGNVWRGSGTILVVDDDEAIRGIASKALERFGFHVLTANDGKESVEVFREHVANIVAVLLDINMPRMNGKQAFREMLCIQRDAKVVFSSGYLENEIAERFGSDGLAGYLQKPYTITELIAKVQEVLGE